MVHYKIISQFAFGDEINLQEELDNFFLTNYVCSIYNHGRNIIIKPTNYLLIELNVVPQGK